MFSHNWAELVYVLIISWISDRTVKKKKLKEKEIQASVDEPEVRNQEFILRAKHNLIKTKLHVLAAGNTQTAHLVFLWKFILVLHNEPQIHVMLTILCILWDIKCQGALNH